MERKEYRFFVIGDHEEFPVTKDFVEGNEKKNKEEKPSAHQRKISQSEIGIFLRKTRRQIPLLLQGQSHFASQNKEELNMANISELELQNLRHLIGGYDITRCKMEDYASATSDAKLKQFFENGAKDAKKNKEQLMGFLK